MSIAIVCDHKPKQNFELQPIKGKGGVKLEVPECKELLPGDSVIT